MGDIADMILEGDLCEVCGDYLGDGDGFPQSCMACASQNDSPRFTDGDGE